MLKTARHKYMQRQPYCESTYWTISYLFIHDAHQILLWWWTQNIQDVVQLIQVCVYNVCQGHKTLAWNVKIPIIYLRCAVIGNPLWCTCMYSTEPSSGNFCKSGLILIIVSWNHHTYSYTVLQILLLLMSCIHV